MNKFRALAALPMLAALAGCGEPGKEEIVQAIGHSEVSDASCASANGQPGYVCTFKLRGLPLTRRIVKLDNGRWDAVN